MRSIQHIAPEKEISMTMFGDLPLKMAYSTWKAFTPFERAVLIICSVLCGFACLWTGDLLGVPRDPGFSGSLLASGSPISGIIVVVIALAICGVIGVLVAKIMGIESGLFCCCIGLAALAVRCGPIRPVLQYASGPSVFLALNSETALLAVIILAVWFVLGRLFKRPRNSQTGELEIAAPNEITNAPLPKKLMTLGVQVLAMGILESILIQSDAKPQAMAGVFISAFGGVMVSYYLFAALPEGIWYWMGPMVLGVLGYLITFFVGATSVTGDIHGWSAALARPTPLDYAGMGTAGALLAYWCSRRWAQPEDGEVETASG